MIDSKTPKTYDKFRNPKSRFHRDKYDRVFGALKANRGWKVLEVGCGTGVYTEFLSDNFSDITAFDIDPEMVNIGKGKNKLRKVRFMVSDSTEIPIRDNSVDLVFGVSILHHISDRRKAFREIARVLKTGGYIAFCEPNRLNPMTSLFQLIQKEDAISRFEMDRLMKENGILAVSQKEILFRSPGISNIIGRGMGLYRIIERPMEKLHMGVTLMSIGKKL